MSMLFGVLGQTSPAATTLTDAYTVPAGRRATVSVVVCNRAGATTVRVSIASNGAADAVAQYVLYDTALAANDTIGTMRLTVGAGDVVRCYSASGAVSFTINGIQEES